MLSILDISEVSFTAAYRHIFYTNIIIKQTNTLLRFFVDISFRYVMECQLKNVNFFSVNVTLFVAF